VLHVLEFDAGRIDDVVAQVNTSGYGLTFGIHSRLDDRVEAICRQVRVGNIYVNRNQIGAVVGVQPFGGEGLSGTGPKAGGPHYLARFTTARDPGPRPSNAMTGVPAGLDGIAADDFAQRAVALQPAWDLAPDRMARLAAAAGAIAAPLGEAVQDAVTTAESWAHSATVLEGPTGERNTLALHGRGIALCLGGTGGAACLARQAILALAAGNAVALAGPDAVPVAAALLPELERAGVPSGLLAPLIEDAAAAAGALPELGVAVFDGDATQATAVRTALAGRDGRRVPQITLVENVDMLVTERVISIDTTASGGNASLLTLSEG
jgi:RHH-type proline utilization regulon transcriptional repressor/proline dehydrogenase/delta 1-pyrroline-5-carboxylate dehydrogenase